MFLLALLVCILISGSVLWYVSDLRFVRLLLSGNRESEICKVSCSHNQRCSCWKRGRQPRAEKLPFLSSPPRTVVGNGHALTEVARKFAARHANPYSAIFTEISHRSAANSSAISAADFSQV